jgi:hypothetical protein
MLLPAVERDSGWEELNILAELEDGKFSCGLADVKIDCCLGGSFPELFPIWFSFY